MQDFLQYELQIAKFLLLAQTVNVAINDIRTDISVPIEMIVIKTVISIIA